MPTKQKMPYIASLDGLRALAVFAVIFYHMGLFFAPGGLLGVTIFFVLSGYLITSLLLIEWNNSGTINLPQFWLRRVRRLFPAIALVILVCGVLFIIFNHALFTKLREDMWTALCWVTNWWYILRDVSYFEALGAPSPLTHFWSLAIEEQFYVVWPVVLLLAHRFGVKREWMRNATLVLVVLSVLEMAFMYSPDVDPSRVYYGTDTRAFSLLIGAALAFVWSSVGLSDKSEVPFPMLPGRAGEIQASIDSRMLLECLGIVGLIGLIVMILLCDGTSAFMYRGGLLLASLFTAAVIAAMVHPASFIGRIFSWQPLVWIGVRSYGIYLWHYPILLLMSPYNTPSMSPWWLLIIEFAIIIALAALSYTFVENPIRHGAIGKFVGEIRSGAQDVATWVQAHLAAIIVSALVFVVFVVGFFAVPYTSAIEGADLLKDDAAQIAGPDSQALSGEESGEGEGAAEEESASKEQTVGADGYFEYDENHLSVLWIGDSVSVRAIPYFTEAFPRGTIDAQVNRWFSTGTEVYRTYNDQGVVGSVVVLALGLNGPIDDAMVDDMMALIGTQRHVIMYNVAGTVSWVGSNNEVIANAAARYPNISVIDWYSLSASGIYFDGDGTHLNEEGAQYYVQLAVDVINANGWLPAEANEPLPVEEPAEAESSDTTEGEGGENTEESTSDSGENTDEGSGEADQNTDENSENAA